MNILLIVTVVFVVLKAVGVIDWSWLLVLSPVLVPLFIAAFVAAAAYLWKS